MGTKAVVNIGGPEELREEQTLFCAKTKSLKTLFYSEWPRGFVHAV